MIPANFKLIGAGTALALSFCAGWFAQGQRLSLTIEQLKHAGTSADLAGARQVIGEMATIQKGVSDAINNYQALQRSNAQAEQELGILLRDLRGVTAGLRGDFAGLPDRIARAAQPALAEYASTCTAVFEAMAAGGQQLAERGADIARAADGHAADAQLMRDTATRPGLSLIRVKK